MSYRAKTFGIVERPLAKDGLLNGRWIRVNNGESFTFGFIMLAAADPSVTLYVDYSVFDLDDAVTDPRNEVGRVNYETVTLAAGVVTKGQLIQYPSPTALKTPFMAMRLRVVEGDAGAAETVTFVVCRNTEG